MSKFEQMPEVETLEAPIENNEELSNKVEEIPTPTPVLNEFLVQKEAEETQERIDNLRQEIQQESIKPTLEDSTSENMIPKEMDSLDKEEDLMNERPEILENFSSLGKPLRKSPEKKPKKKKNFFVKFLARNLLSKEEYKTFVGGYEKGQQLVDKAENLIKQKPKIEKNINF